MNFSASSGWHFYIMIVVSSLIFIAIIRIILTKSEFEKKRGLILLLSFVVVILGMLFGKFGANKGFPWWIYYTIPLLANVLLPPIALKLGKRRTVFYLFLSFLSAPLIHAVFSFVLGWKEYMPFWNIPYWKSLIR